METQITTKSVSGSSAVRVLPLAGKVALVTGGSRGIGAGIAERLAADGAAVAITYAGSKPRADETVARIVAKDGRALAIEADSANPEAIEAAVLRTVEAFGGLDILVNNAGIARMGELRDLRAEDLEAMLAVNVRGPVVATKAALAHMKSGGRIINIGSINSEVVPFAGISVYALTKGALSGFTHGLAHELGPRGITVNNLQPGPVDTDMNPASGPMAATLLGHSAVGRYGKTSEIGAFVAFLASEDGGYITGADLRVDGGFGT